MYVAVVQSLEGVFVALIIRICCDSRSGFSLKWIPESSSCSSSCFMQCLGPSNEGGDGILAAYLQPSNEAGFNLFSKIVVAA